VALKSMTCAVSYKEVGKQELIYPFQQNIPLPYLKLMNVNWCLFFLDFLKV